MYGGGDASASVFQNVARWPTDSDDLTRIRVCIEPTSSTSQRADGAAGGLIHDRNPNLQEVVDRVRAAVTGSWERWSSVRFIDWQMCNTLPAGTRGSYVGIYIHPDAENESPVGTRARGRTTSFKPWDNDFNRCISYNASTTHVQYRYDCVEQYAIHELGHVMGLSHEWSHPLAPASCGERSPLAPGTYLDVYSSSVSATVVNPQYDWDSIMTYVDGCVHQSGVRFGSKRPSDADILGGDGGLPAPDQPGPERVQPRLVRRPALDLPHQPLGAGRQQLLGEVDRLHAGVQRRSLRRRLLDLPRPALRAHRAELLDGLAQVRAVSGAAAAAAARRLPARPPPCDVAARGA